MHSEFNEPPVRTKLEVKLFPVTRQVQVDRGFIRTKMVTEQRTETVYDWTVVTEDDPRYKEAHLIRTYHKCRRQLLRVVQAYNKGTPTLMGFFLNYEVHRFSPEYVSIKIDRALVDEYGGKPFAEISVGSERRLDSGKWSSHSWGSWLVLYFATEAQANAYIIAAGSGMPRRLMHEGSSYELQSNGSYVSPDGGVLPLAIMLFFLTTSVEGRAELVSQYPELANLTPPDALTFGDSASSDASSAVTNGASGGFDGSSASTADFGSPTST